ncbi:MAG: tryptophan 7-halogenase [Polyangiaceae bacterium]|nr:tryptophan 7-halogenase [Polyangiaceae bacterium]
MRQDCDVLVLGGGPGGSTLASCLAMKNLSAIVLERETFPRFHIGESLLPCSCEVFHKIGVQDVLEDRFLRKYGARFLCSTTRRTASYTFAEAFNTRFDHAYQVPRADFDHILLKHAAGLGADVRERWEAIEVMFEGERAVGVRARNLDEPEKVVELRSRVVVDATGRDTLLASRSRRKAKIARLDKTAFFTHYKNTFREEGTREGNIQIVVWQHGWFWFIPFRGDVTSVGAVASAEWIREQRRTGAKEPGDFFDRAVADSCWATEFLQNAERQRNVGSIADFSYRIDQLAGDSWLFVGDAAGFLDPLFSTGAHLAVKSADLAANAIAEALARGDTSRAAFANYEKSVRYAVDLFLGVVQAFYKGEFRETLFEANQRQTLRRIITSVLSGDVFHEGVGPQPHWASFLVKQYPAELPSFA